MFLENKLFWSQRKHSVDYFWDRSKTKACYILWLRDSCFPTFCVSKDYDAFFFFFWVFFHTNDSRGSSEIATARAFLVRKHLQDNLCHINFEESSLTKTLFWRMGFLRLQVTTGNFGISEKIRKELKWAISIRSFWKLKQTKYSHQW